MKTCMRSALRQAAELAEGPAEVIGLAKTLMARSFETSLVDMLSFEGFGQALAMANPGVSRRPQCSSWSAVPADFARAATGEFRHSS